MPEYFGMAARDQKDLIADKHRAALRYWRQEMDISVDAWCKKAGIREGTLRNFLSGASETMQGATLERLAAAIGLSVGQLLREDTHKVDERLIMLAGMAVEKAAKAQKRKLSAAELIGYSVKLYNDIMRYRRSGDNIMPSEALASYVLKENISGS